MTTSTILAIDLGKYNSVACHYEPETKATTFRTIRTTPDEMRKLLARQPVKLVVLEACSASVEVAWCSLRYNSWAKSHWLHLTEENGVSRKKAVVALGRKLLVRCWGMLKTETAWQDPLVSRGG